MRLVACEFRIEAAQIVEDAEGRIEQADMLVENRDAVGVAADVAARRFEFARDQAKQRGLAGAIGAADRDALGSADSNDSGPNSWRSQRPSDVLEGDQFAAVGQIRLRQIDRKRRQDFDPGARSFQRLGAARRSGDRRGGFRARRCSRHAPSPGP